MLQHRSVLGQIKFSFRDVSNRANSLKLSLLWVCGMHHVFCPAVPKAIDIERLRPAPFRIFDRIAFCAALDPSSLARLRNGQPSMVFGTTFGVSKRSRTLVTRYSA